MKLYRFPLGCLNLDPFDPRETLEHILIAAMLWEGERIYISCDTDEERRAAIARLIWPDGSHSTLPTDEELYIAHARLEWGITGSSIAVDLKRAAKVREHLAKATHAERENFVSIKSEWFWRAMATTRKTIQSCPQSGQPPLEWREFRLLCALSSKLGTSKAVPIGWQEFQARAAGWCGKLAMRRAELSEAGRREPLVLSRSQIRTGLARLEEWRMLTRTAFRAGSRGGRMWYSFLKDRASARERMLEGEENRTEYRRASRLAEFRAGDLAAVRAYRDAHWQRQRNSPAPS